MIITNKNRGLINLYTTQNCAKNLFSVNMVKTRIKCVFEES